MSAAELFAGAGSKPGVEVWRIEALKPVKQSTVDGKFYSGDSYIVLHTWEQKGATYMNVHFWIGSESSRDEAGAAALLTVELDQFLGDLPTQFRETQGSESNEFLQLFKNGVQYLDGGVDSAFNKVDRDAYTTRLLHVKGGKRNVRVMSVPVEVASLNDGDVFILDTGKVLYQWNGKHASRMEKAKALDVTLAIRSEEHGGKSQVVALGDAEDATESSSSALKAFFAELGCDDVAKAKAKIKSAAEGGDDDDAVAAGAAVVRLYHASDESGTLNTTEVTDRPLMKDALKTEDVFVLVAGGVVYAWVGKKASPGERKGAMTTAVKFVEVNGLPPNAPVKIVKEGTEPALFKQAFHQWNKPSPPPHGGSGGGGSSMQKKKPERKRAEVDAAALAGGRGGGEAESMVDDGSGELKIWRVENFARVPVAREKYGQFYAGDSYVLLYTYDGGKQHVIYFWQGRDSTADEKGASALLSKELDDSLGGQAAQVRVAMGKEPGHFRRLFKGRMVVHSGGKAGAFKNRAEVREGGRGLYRAAAAAAAAGGREEEEEESRHTLTLSHSHTQSTRITHIASPHPF